MRDDDSTPTPTVVADDGAEARRTPDAGRERTTAADILDAIRAIPGEVAARVGDNGPSAQGGDGVAEVTFVPEPPPPAGDPEAEGEEDEPEGQPVPASPSSEHRPRFRFPGAARRRKELIDA